MTSIPRVVVIGAGFGGLWAARELAGSPVEVLLIDRENYHSFWPLLYQVAAVEVEPEGIAYPVRTILRRQKNARFALGEVIEIDFDSHTLKTKHISYYYDFLVIAIGSVTNYFGIPGAEEFSFPLKFMDDGIELRNHVLNCFERAAQEPDEKKRREILTFAIAGGGPTGVEFAGALAELIRHPLVEDYPNLNLKEAKVVILEAKDKLLPQQITCCNDYVRTRLNRMGVEVKLGSGVNQVTKDAIYLQDGTVIPTETVVWTTGVQGDPKAAQWGLPLAKGGRVEVLPTLQVPDHPEVYVVGDLAYLEEVGHPLPQIAPVAIQQGTHAAQNIKRRLAGKDQLPFKYIDRGTMAVIGRNAAVAEIRGKGFTGFPAWLLWLGVHLYKLIGFRNRILVLINWAIDYIFYERNVRLILP